MLKKKEKKKARSRRRKNTKMADAKAFLLYHWRKFYN